MSRRSPHTLDAYTFPVPPVCTHYWNERTWIRWARTSGRIARRGPAPSIMWDGKVVPFDGFTVANPRQAGGLPAYDTSRAYRPMFPRLAR